MFLRKRNEPGGEGEGRKGGSALAVSKEGVQNGGVFEERYLLRRKSPQNREDFKDPLPVVHQKSQFPRYVCAARGDRQRRFTGLDRLMQQIQNLGVSNKPEIVPIYTIYKRITIISHPLFIT